MNAAIEADDADPILQEKAQEAMDDLFGLIRRLIRKGMEQGEVKQGVDPDYVATVFISTLEGALMLSKLYRNPDHMKKAVHHVRLFLVQHFA